MILYLELIEVVLLIEIEYFIESLVSTTSSDNICRRSRVH